MTLWTVESGLKVSSEMSLYWVGSQTSRRPETVGICAGWPRVVRYPPSAIWYGAARALDFRGSVANTCICVLTRGSGSRSTRVRNGCSPSAKMWVTHAVWPSSVHAIPIGDR